MIKTATLNTILAILIVLALLIFSLAFGTACGGGDDDTSCMAAEDCPDAGGPMAVDADTLAPDADMTPDANPDPCAAYAQYSGQIWVCETNYGPSEFPVLLEEYNGTCAVAMFLACLNPPLEDLAAGELTCTVANTTHTQHCWRP